MHGLRPRHFLPITASLVAQMAHHSALLSPRTRQKCSALATWPILRQAPSVRLTLAPLGNFDVGALCAALIVFVAYRFKTLTIGGAIAAFVVGTCAFGGLGFRGAAILLAFFVTSAALSHVGRAQKQRSVDGGKHGPRDGGQVIANGGVGAICALLALGPDPRWSVAFAGAFAAATADTWATEVGTPFGGLPHSIFTWRPVAVGLSGGVTIIGSLAAGAGALLIGAIAYAVGLGQMAAIVAGGLAGMLCDSLLGGSLQSLRWCPQCQRACETEPHACGATTTPIRGFTWFSNDVVNFAATLCGALVALALMR